MMDDVEDEKNYLHQQRSEVAVLKEQLENKMREIQSERQHQIILEDGHRKEIKEVNLNK